MTNRQWLIWKLIDMSDEELANLFLLPICNYAKRDNLELCRALSSCSECRRKWLQQEHVESNAI